MVMESTSQDDPTTATKDVAYDELASIISHPDANKKWSCLTPGRKEDLESHVRAYLNAKSRHLDPDCPMDREGRRSDQDDALTCNDFPKEGLELPNSEDGEKVEVSREHGLAPSQECRYLDDEPQVAHRPTLLLHEGTWYASIPGLDAFESTKPSSIHQSHGREKSQDHPCPPREHIAQGKPYRIFGWIKLGLAAYRNFDPLALVLKILVPSILLILAAPALIGPARSCPSTSPTYPSSKTSSPPVATHIGQIPLEPFAIQPVSPTSSKFEHHATSCPSQACSSLWCCWLVTSSPPLPREDYSDYTFLFIDGPSIADYLRKEHRACVRACVPEKSVVDNMECEDVYLFKNQGAITMCPYDHGDGDRLPKLLQK